jgi:hypothetical protein
MSHKKKKKRKERGKREKRGLPWYKWVTRLFMSLVPIVIDEITK